MPADYVRVYGTNNLANNVLSADAAGRAKMQDAYLILSKILDGIFTADAAGRAKFAAGFVDDSLIAAAANIAFSKLAMAPIFDYGLSSSGSAGTTVLDLQPAVGNKVAVWTCFAWASSASNTVVRVTVTFTDDTTAQLDHVGGVGAIYANAGGMFRNDGTNVDFGVKEVKRIHVTTQSTGLGTRVAVASGLEVVA